MSDMTLNYLIQLMGVLVLPQAVLLLVGWRVSRLRSLNEHNYQEKVKECASNTIKEQMADKVVTPLFDANNVVLPPGTSYYDVIDTLVPVNNVPLLTQMYNDLAQLGIDSNTYPLLLQIVNTLGGGG